MTAKELIEELKKYPEDWQVVFDDYSQGYTDIEELTVGKRMNYAVGRNTIGKNELVNVIVLE